MPDTLACPGPERLQQFLAGCLPAAEADSVARHLGACAHCLAAAMAADNTAALRLSVAADIVPPPPEKTAVGELVGRLKTVPPLTPQEVTAVAGGGAGPPSLANLLDPADGPEELGRLGAYRILRVLGRGGMGVVLLAEQERPRRRVAVKVIIGLLGGTAPDRFRREADVVARLRHANIVQVHEVGEHRGHAYFAMEYLEGGNLAQKLADAPLPPRAAAELVAVLARATHHAHQYGIIHRDLKPANVLLTHDGQPKITDFGLAKQLEGAGDPTAQLTQTGAIVGTPAYMAPEQASGQSVGPATDVWALGVILYECLTGRPPFKGATPLETLEQVRSRDPLSPGRLQPGLPRDLQTVCLKCLEKEPARRYSSAAALADDLGRFLRGEPITARPVSVLERLGKWARRQPAQAALAAASVLFVVILLAGALAYQARLRAEVARAEATAEALRQQHERADANYRNARETVQRMLGRLRQGDRLALPRPKELERQQLEDALIFFQKVLDEQGDLDPAVRRDIAQAYQQTADLQGRLGDLGRAADNYRRARALLSDLHAAAPDDDPVARDLAGCCAALARILTWGDHPQWAQAEECYQQALALHRAMAGRHPDDPDSQNGLAWYCYQLGEMYSGPSARPLGTVAENGRRAAGYFAEARDVERGLVRTHPENAMYRGHLALFAVSLAQAHRAAGQEAQAQQAAREAEPFLKELVGKGSGDTELAVPLGGVWLKWGVFLLPNRPKEAIGAFTRAVNLLDPVIRQEPNDLHAQINLTSCLRGRAQAYDTLEQYAPALADWDRAIEICVPSHRLGLRLERTWTLAKLGKHERCIAEVEALLGEKLDGLALYNLACACALAAGSVKAEAARADRYAGRAMTLLRRSQAEGFFKSDYGRGLLKTDTDLDALRRRPEFRELLRQITAGPAPAPAA
jgi:serine/threonine-protein kinase